jgi:two-component system alkaline phosphatase synthesis response regulator PhoP
MLDTIAPAPTAALRPNDGEPTHSMSQNILIVEDEVDLAHGIQDALVHKGFRADAVHDGKVALERLRRGGYDLVVLDLMLPGMNGLDVLRTLRKERPETRVLILTALSSEEDLLEGFQAGADDYLSKPCSPRELVARVEAQFRRRALDAQPPPRLDLPSGISVDLARLEVHRDGKIIPLTPREGDILEYLVRHRDRVVTRDDLLLDVWHYKSANVETRTVDIHIVGLRRKVEPNPAKPTLIQTVRGKGYRWFS